jgi:hypothetical protein
MLHFIQNEIGKINSEPEKNEFPGFVFISLESGFKYSSLMKFPRHTTFSPINAYINATGPTKKIKGSNSD